VDQIGLHARPRWSTPRSKALDIRYGGRAILRLGITEERSDNWRREVGKGRDRVKGMPSNADEQ